MKNAVQVGQVVYAKVSGQVRMVKVTKGGVANIKGVNLSTGRTITLKTLKAIRGIAGRI